MVNWRLTLNDKLHSGWPNFCNYRCRCWPSNAVKDLISGEITGRNAFLIFAALMGTNPQAGALSLGVHAGTSYYDCGQEFIIQVGEVVNRYSEGELALHCPFLQQDKAFVYDYARTVGIPLSLTYSCEFGTVPPCGKCMSCMDRNALQAR